MDFAESTKVVFNRIQGLEPENATKIMGYLLMLDNVEHDMIRLALGPESLIHSLINLAKVELRLPGPLVSWPISQQPSQPDRGLFQINSLSPISAGPRIFQQALAEQNMYWEPQMPQNRQVIHNPDSFAEGFHYRNHIRYLGREDQVSPSGLDYSRSYYCPEPALAFKASPRSPNMPGFPTKICHYFNRGFCKHGSSCKYLHVHPESFQQNYSIRPPNEHPNEEHVVSPRSLERLEIDIIELLRSRKGFPVSIASLPMMYYEKYGRSLQAEGYLAESQRHGKTGYSLTRLLARLKNSIRLIDRPHGQHSVILVEDVPRYLEYYASERNGGIVSGSRQIYLTFPAESTFTEHDIAIYFNNFGPVQDVRIPCQQERMFGFVTFVFPETVRQILSKGNPHFVCDARVLVKPYREKSRLFNRKFSDKMLHPVCRHFIAGNLDFSQMPPRVYGMPRFRKHEQAFELERRCFSEMNLTSMTFTHQPNFSYSVDDLNLIEEQEELESPEDFDYLLDPNASTSEENKLRNISTEHNNQDCEGLNLPESPFASAIGNEISTFA